MINAFLGISSDFLDMPVPYLRVLGLGEVGAQVLKRPKKQQSCRSS